MALITAKSAEDGYEISGAFARTSLESEEWKLVAALKAIKINIETSKGTTPLSQSTIPLYPYRGRGYSHYCTPHRASVFKFLWKMKTCDFANE